jgi:hypothetical protein
MRKFLIKILENRSGNSLGYVDMVLDQETYPSEKQVKDKYYKDYDFRRNEIVFFSISEISKEYYESYISQK